MKFETIYKKFNIRRKNSGTWRELPQNDKGLIKVLDFSNNDYLCLSKNPSLTEVINKKASEYGLGSTGSRLLSGQHCAFTELETMIAYSKNEEAALVFNSGYQTNVGVLSALCNQNLFDEKPLVFFDRLNHASLYQGAKLSEGKIIPYPHNDMYTLEKLLNKHSGPSKFIVCETLHGMDGDIAPLEDLKFLAKKHSAFLYLDEAHATGVYGKNGYGLSTTIDLGEVEHVVMGTFSKALGSFGGFVTGTQTIIDYITNAAPGFIYSTAMPPIMAAVNLEAWRMVKKFSEERSHIWDNAHYLRSSLKNLGLNILKSDSHIIPVILQDPKACMLLKQKLENKGLKVSGIRPPSVPAGTSRLRITLNSSHSRLDVDKLIKAFNDIGAEEIGPKD